MSRKRIFLIDATAFCYRAFYAFSGLATSFGQPTNAIFGFVNILNKILREHKPDYVAICFDVSRDTFRQKKFAEYKIQRPPMPDDLVSQMSLIRDIVKAYNLKIFEKEGFEADDVIATLAKLGKAQGLDVVIVSSDKDILQLVEDRVKVFSPYKDEGTLYDEEKVKERFGVASEIIPDVISLMGDATDNIPNIPGIGEGFALKLIQEFGSLDNLLQNIDKVKQEKIKNTLKENIKTLELNKELVVLDKNIELDFKLEDLKVVEPNYQELARIFKHLEFKKFLQALPIKEEAQAVIEIDNIEDNKVKSLVKDGDELILCGQDLDSLVFCVQEKIFKVVNPSENLKDTLANEQIKKVGHDLKALKVALKKADIELNGLYFDTMIAAYLINPSKGNYDLPSVAWDILGRADAIIDNQNAVGLIVKLKEKLELELNAKSLIKLFFETEMPLVNVLARMEINGIKLDLDVLKELSIDIQKRLEGLIKDIYRISGCEFNINSPKQLSEVLFEKLKLPVVKKTKTGASTNEEVLNVLAKKHELPAHLLEYRQLTKLKNTYIDTLPLLVDAKTGKIHTSFNQTGTETGRLSSSNPNLQNIPVKTEIGRNIRRAVIAQGKNNFLLSCDYSQVELRILAHLSGDETLIAAFGASQDIHKATAALIYGVQENDVNDAMRETAKRVNFGIVYGQSAYGLARDLEISIDDAQKFIDAYFLRYPKVKAYIDSQTERAEKLGFVTTILGRRRYIPEIKNKNIGIRQFAQRQAVNTPIQGSASDLIKLAMIEIQNLVDARKLKSQMTIQIHDELVFDVLKDELKEMLELIKNRMENVLALQVPVKVEIKQGKNWLEMERLV